MFGDRKTPGPAAAWAFFVDFDGTITDRDGFEVLVRHFRGDDEWERGERELLERRSTLREALARQTSYVRGSFEDVYALHAREIGIDPEFAPFVERCEARGVMVSVVSSGIGPLIERRLADAGLGRLPVFAPGAEPGDDAWTMHFTGESENGTDKAGLIRRVQGAGVRVAFAGDGQSDYEAAVAADLRYAKAGRKLDGYLRDRGLPFEPFTTFADIAVP